MASARSPQGGGAGLGRDRPGGLGCEVEGAWSGSGPVWGREGCRRPASRGLPNGVLVRRDPAYRLGWLDGMGAQGFGRGGSGALMAGGL